MKLVQKSIALQDLAQRIEQHILTMKNHQVVMLELQSELDTGIQDFKATMASGNIEDEPVLQIEVPAVEVQQ